MLNRVLLLLDVLLLIGAGALGVHLYDVAKSRPAADAPASRGAATSTPAATEAPAPVPSGSLASYTVVAERNLFSPTRNEASPEPPKPVTTATAPAAPVKPPGPKPRLYGVIIGRDGGPRAYLEDPKTRKVFSFAVGDTIADSRVEQIGGDRVVLRRGAETYEVLLRDPSKPRAATHVPTAPGVPGGPPFPTVPPGVGVPLTPASPQAPGTPLAPGALPPTFPGMPGATASPENPQVPVPGQPYDPLVHPTPMVPGAPMPGQPPVVFPGTAPALPTRPIIPGRPAPRVPVFPPPPAGLTRPQPSESP